MSGFEFKQFTVEHDRCAMKIGTDGVLLGAWAPIDHLIDAPIRHIIDVGSGSGLIALMLAQRLAGKCRIEAVELDPNAAHQATDNVASSPWPSSITVHNTAIQLFESQQNVDLIVSNPPYFPAGQSFSSPERQQARHTSHLSAAELTEFAVTNLKRQGLLAVIIPATESLKWQHAASSSGLVLHDLVAVHSEPDKGVIRHLLSFGFEQSVQSFPLVAQEQIFIRNKDQSFHPSFAKYTHPFYLKIPSPAE